MTGKTATKTKGTYSEDGKERMRIRNQKVREFFTSLEEQNPEWRLDALLKKTAENFPPISAATVSAIIKRTGTYAD